VLNKRRVKTVLGRIVGMSGAHARTFRSAMTILAFHRVNDQMPEDELTCTSAKFEAFCRFFRDHACVVPFSAQVSGCREGKDMSGTVSITFDDGYLDNFEVAAPILHALRMPATFFITTGFIGSQVIAPWDRELARQPGWMSWDNVRALVSQGFEIGAHTNTHIDLGSADEQTQRRELELSKHKIEQELGIPVQLFAYPFGGPRNISSRSRELVRELGFLCCASCYGGLNAVGASPYHLLRIPIAEWFTTPYQLAFECLMGRWNGQPAVLKAAVTP
jgi:peptidoglycan/xylan/chitin deacetylase (PgdA/CDA1 family)